MRKINKQAGFSLVEIMVGMVIGLLATIVIFQVFAVSEGQKRTTTSGADAQQNGLMALYHIERDVRVAGFGVTALDCTTINAYNANRSPANYTFQPFPAIVTADSPAAGSDSVEVFFSEESTSRIPTTLQSAMLDSTASLNVINGAALKGSDLVLISQLGQPCSLVQASDDAKNVGAAWNVPHASGAPYPHNASGTEIFPPGGYGAGARVFELNTPINRRYFVQNGSLMVRDLLNPDAATNTVALVNGIVALKAQYGRDNLPAGAPDGVVDVWDNTAPTALTEVVAMRIGLVARSGLAEKDVVSPATLTVWPAGAGWAASTMALTADQQRFRYRVYHTVVPLRNVIWN